PYSRLASPPAPASSRGRGRSSPILARRLPHPSSAGAAWSPSRLTSISTAGGAPQRGPDLAPVDLTHSRSSPRDECAPGAASTCRARPVLARLVQVLAYLPRRLGLGAVQQSVPVIR